MSGIRPGGASYEVVMSRPPPGGGRGWAVRPASLRARSGRSRPTASTGSIPPPVTSCDASVCSAPCCRACPRFRSLLSSMDVYRATSCSAMTGAGPDHRARAGQLRGRSKATTIHKPIEPVSRTGRDGAPPGGDLRRAGSAASRGVHPAPGPCRAEADPRRWTWLWTRGYVADVASAVLAARRPGGRRRSGVQHWRAGHGYDARVRQRTRSAGSDAGTGDRPRRGRARGPGGDAERRAADFAVTAAS